MLTADFTNEKVLVSNISFARQDLDNGGSDIRSMIVVKCVCLMLKNEFSLPKTRSLATMLKIVHELLETPPLTQEQCFRKLLLFHCDSGWSSTKHSKGPYDYTIIQYTQHEHSHS